MPGESHDVYLSLSLPTCPFSLSHRACSEPRPEHHLENPLSSFHSSSTCRMSDLVDDVMVETTEIYRGLRLAFHSSCPTQPIRETASADAASCFFPHLYYYALNPPSQSRHATQCTLFLLSQFRGTTRNTTAQLARHRAQSPSTRQARYPDGTSTSGRASICRPSPASRIARLAHQPVSHRRSVAFDRMCDLCSHRCSRPLSSSGSASFLKYRLPRLGKHRQEHLVFVFGAKFSFDQPQREWNAIVGSASEETQLHLGSSALVWFHHGQAGC